MKWEQSTIQTKNKWEKSHSHYVVNWFVSSSGGFFSSLNKCIQNNYPTKWRHNGTYFFRIVYSVWKNKAGKQTTNLCLLNIFYVYIRACVYCFACLHLLLLTSLFRSSIHRFDFFPFGLLLSFAYHFLFLLVFSLSFPLPPSFSNILYDYISFFFSCLDNRTIFALCVRLAWATHYSYKTDAKPYRSIYSYA